MLRQMLKTLIDSGVFEQSEFSPESMRVCTDSKKPPLDTLLMMSNGGFKMILASDRNKPYQIIALAV